MKITHYACDLCGAVITNLTNMEQIEIQCMAENYNITTSYDVCPYCAKVFKEIDRDKIHDLLLSQLKTAVNKYE